MGLEPIQSTTEKVNEISVEAQRMQKGSYVAAVSMLNEVNELRQEGRLSKAGDVLRQTGTGVVGVNAAGEINELSISPLDKLGHPTGKVIKVKIDLDRLSINDLPEEELRARERKQLTQFADAVLESKKLSVSDRARESTKELAQALIEGDASAVERAVKPILKDTKLMDEVYSGLTHLTFMPNITFTAREDGNHFMRLQKDINSSVLFPKEGGPMAVRTSSLGEPLFDPNPGKFDVSATFKAGRDEYVRQLEEMVEYEQKRVPQIRGVDSPANYSDMRALHKAFEPR